MSAGPESNTAAGALSKYRLIAELGHGGMAEVYLALSSGPAGFNKLVVLKQIREQLAEDPEFLNMFLDEARLAARLNHPNVVQTNEVGQENGRYFIAMEYLEGQPLNRIISRLGKAGQLSLAMHVKVIIDALAGLHYAHDLADFDGTPLQVVHRDATPHNVFVTYTGQVKVVDFGIAKAFGSTSETRTGVLKGKVAYMAPEQAMGERVDRRADVFSVGMMLWEALAGKRLFKGVNDVVVLQKIAAGDIPKPSTLNPDVPPSLEAICMKALAHDKQDRWSSARELQHALEHALEELGERPMLRDLGAALSLFFEAERTTIKGLVEAQIQSARSAGPGGVEALVRLPRIEGQPTEAGSLSGSRTGGSSLRPTPVSQVSQIGPLGGSSLTAANLLAPASVPTPAPPQRNLTLLVVGVAAVGAVAAFALLRTVTPSAGAGQAAAASAPAEAKTTRMLKIESTPPGATVTEDERPLGKTPMAITLDPASTATRKLVLSLDGYTPYTISQAPSTEDVKILIPLTPAPVAAPAAPTDAAVAGLGRPVAKAPLPSGPSKAPSPATAAAKTPPAGLDINLSR
ncbi:MAG: serine/threonine-protein kinase [Byssovorax sp.]